MTRSLSPSVTDILILLVAIDDEEAGIAIFPPAAALGAGPDSQHHKHQHVKQNADSLVTVVDNEKAGAANHSPAVAALPPEAVVVEAAAGTRTSL